MNLILAIPLEVRLAVLFAVGICIGGLLNLGVYRLAWHPRPISPWWPPHPDAPPRRWTDRLPVYGWLGLRRESGLHGQGFWIRPMAVELLSGFGFAGLYWWEIGRQGLLPPGLQPLPLNWLAVLHQEFASHSLLIALMVAASLIDIDEKIIPDAITVPGTCLGLVLASVLPRSLLPDVAFLRDGPHLGFLHLASPHPPAQFLFAWPLLLIAVGCWWLWCVALMPRTWYPRHGWCRAVGLSLARLAREPVTYRILLMGLIGSMAVAAGWLVGGLSWLGLLSGLAGMVGGGGLTWLVRVVGTKVLRREAMGFGDVTLMAMIGAFLGWQTCLVVFFIAPFATLVVGTIQWISRREHEIPYGPFLCLAAVVTIVNWAAIWNRVMPVFWLGWLVPVLVPTLMLCGLVLMAIVRGLWQLARSGLR